MHVYICHIYLYMYVFMYIHAYTCMYIYAYTYAHTQRYCIHISQKYTSRHQHAWLYNVCSCNTSLSLFLSHVGARFSLFLNHSVFFDRSHTYLSHRLLAIKKLVQPFCTLQHLIAQAARAPYRACQRLYG